MNRKKAESNKRASSRKHEAEVNRKRIKKRKEIDNQGNQAAANGPGKKR